MSEGPAWQGTPTPGPQATAARLLDVAMPWLMVGWALFAVFVAVPLARPWGSNDGGRFAGFLAATVVVWAALAATASALALRHAKATSDLPRLAWCGVVAALVLALPMAVTLLSEQHYTEDFETTCSPGPIPKTVAGALLGWMPWGAYVWTPAVAGLVGLGLLVPATTRRPGAWMLASTVMGAALALSGGIMIINQCD